MLPEEQKVEPDYLLNFVSSLKQKNDRPQEHVAFSFLTFPEKGECFDNLIVRSFG